jgi:hypothetical protein
MLRRLMGSLGATAALTLAGTQVQAATNLVSGYLYGSHTWSATNTYVLNGFTYVMSNAVVHIEPGTVIQGVPGTGTGAAAANDFGVLYVCRGGKLEAVGTPTKPIIFTAAQDDVSDPADLPFPSRGLWGGLVLFGNARLNNPASTTNQVNFDTYEGLPDTAVTNTVAGPFQGQVDYIHRFGGDDDSDSSGAIRYVSVRHGGKKLTTDKEINGVSLGGVGRGTTFEFVEAYATADDGFEFFGGSVDTKYLISAFNDDDGFDTDQGFHGRNQFWFAIQAPDARDSGSEQNGQPQPNDVLVDGAQPLSSYEIYNATFIGAGTTGSGNAAHNIRRANFCRWYNSVFTQFQGRRVLLDATSTPEFKNNLFWDFAGAGASGDVWGTSPSVPAALNPMLDPKLRSVSRTQDGGLDPRPTPDSPVFSDVRTAPVDGFYTPVNFKGAFDANDNWASGWSALATEGVFAPRDNEVQVPAGYLYGTHNWSATNQYILQGFVYVMSNAVLNIEAGTVIKGVPGTGTGASAANDFGCLFVCRGGKLNALGTANSPIILTGEQDDVLDTADLPFPSRGLWGGLVLFGNARLNNPASTTNQVNFDTYEGLPDVAVTNQVAGPFLGQVDYIHRFGGDDDNDSSGVIRYVSVRHGGKKLTTDKEINGVSFGCVGRGTTFEYVEAYATADDGFEFFGGSVNTRYLVSAFNDDDGFDTDQGYHGQNQFWFLIQGSDVRDSGSEQNGQPQPNDVLVEGAQPLSNYEIYNATFIGAGTTGSGNAAHNIRRANFCRWYNSVFTQFQGRRVLIDATSTPDFKNNLFWDFAGAGTSGDVWGTSASVPADLNPMLDPQLASISRTTDGLLDPIPALAGNAYTFGRRTPDAAFYTATAYVGAFGQENWTQDWTALGSEGVIKVRPLRTGGPLPTVVAPTNLKAEFVNGQVRISWEGSATLEASDTLSGGYGTVGTTSPVNLSPEAAAKFLRLRH